MIRKPKITVIGLKGLPAIGGAAAVGESLIKVLLKSFNFTVLSVASHAERNAILSVGIRQIVFHKHGKGGLNTLFYYFKSLMFSLTGSYGLVHLHHAESGFITPFLRLKYKVLVTFHGVYRENDPKFPVLYNAFFRWSERLNIRFANEVVSVSYPDCQYIYQKYGRQIKYIPNGIRLDENIMKILDKKETQDYLFFAAGRIYEIKGLHLLLDAIKSINEKIHLKIAGDLNQVPSYTSQIEKQAKGLDVEFLGMIKEKEVLMQLVAGAKLFVFPSLTEAMSMMLLEVVSMKTPVIASDIPANKSVFSEDEVLFFRSNDVHDLEVKIRFALAHPEILSRMADKAYEKLCNEYTWESIGPKYEEIYKKLLD